MLVRCVSYVIVIVIVRVIVVLELKQFEMRERSEILYLISIYYK